MIKKLTKTCILVIALFSLAAIALTACGSDDSMARTLIQSATGATSSQAAAIERIISDAGIEVASIVAVTDDELDELSSLLNFSIEAYEITSTDGGTYSLLLNGDNKTVLFLACEDSGEFFYGNLEQLIEDMLNQMLDGLFDDFEQ